MVGMDRYAIPMVTCLRNKIEKCFFEDVLGK